MKIKEIQRILLDVPFDDVSERNMERDTHGWHIVEICRVIADNGMTGLGETLPHYTWGKVTEESINHATGKNLYELIWEDTLGCGLQMAILDLCAKAA
jgi:L-alanine-DL-glutamate epimerase-like enolase superfamily enzyme